MAKRFTDTEKWDDDWFLELTPAMKCVWSYLRDHCDGAGLLKMSFRKMSDMVGVEISRDEFNAAFGDRVLWLSDDRVWLTGFIRFQYKKLSLESIAHKNIAKKALAAVVGIEATGRALKAILFLNEFISSQPNKEDPRASPGRPSNEGQAADKGYSIKDKGKSIRKGSVREKHSYTPEFEAAYLEYPLRKDKVDAFKAFQKTIRSEDQQLFIEAIRRYSSDLASRGETKYIRHMSTFINDDRWREWTDPATGTVNLPQQKSVSQQWLEKKLAEDAARNQNAVP